MSENNGNKPRTEYMRLDFFLDKFHPRNAKSHDIGAIISSIVRFGFVEQPTVDENTGYVVAGHGRGEALAKMMQQQMDMPERIEADSDGMWKLPVTRGISFRDEAHVNAYLIASNRLVSLGGWNDHALAEMLQELALEDEELLTATGYDGDDLDNLLEILSTPSLEDLEAQYGEPLEDDFWPIIRAKVSPELYQRFLDATNGEDDEQRLIRLLEQYI